MSWLIGILIVVSVLLLLPIVAKIDYNGAFEIRVGFITPFMKIYPTHVNRKKGKKKNKSKKKKDNQKEKAKLKRIKRHSSWLRIYAIRLSEGVYVITGGAIKLTLKMEEREHTRQELVKLEQVREFLLSENIIDDDSFVEYMNML